MIGGLALALAAWSLFPTPTFSPPALAPTPEIIEQQLLGAPPADPALVEAGRQLYLANCAACHGERGRGDGPAATGMRPPPSDFTQHMRPDQHTDEEIYRLISDGVPNSAMLPWRERLTENEIRQVVGFLRTFGQADPALAGGAGEALPSLVFAHQGNLWRSDGAGIRQLTALAAGQSALHPSLSPDGRTIAFVVVTPPLADAPEPLPTAALHVMAPDGSGQRSVWAPASGLLGVTRWAPDGAAIYVGVDALQYNADSTISSGGYSVVRVDLAAGSAMPVLTDALDPTVAPDGTQIAYLRLNPADGLPMSVYVARSDGGDARVVLDGLFFEGFHTPLFSPDGRSLIVSARGGPPTDTEGYPLPLESAPSASLLQRLFGSATAKAHGGAWELWHVNIDGSGLRRMTNFAEDDPVATFSPDGTQIAVLGTRGLYLMNADGSRLRQVASMSGPGGLVWLTR
jgi:mono/diheme cytochrome c family protein/Tol biopolymer transport system component